MNDFTQKLRLLQSFPFEMELKASGLVVRNQLSIFLEFMYKYPDKIVWTNMVMPTELFYALDLVPVHTELIAGWFSTLNLSKKYIQIAHSKGYNVNLCSYHKVIIGAMEAGVLPTAKLAVFSSHICDGGSLLARYLHERFLTDVKILDIPYEVSKESQELLSEQVSQLYLWLSRRTACEDPLERLRGSIRLSNLQRQYQVKANHIRSMKSVFWGNLAIRNLYGMMFLAGSLLGVKVASTYYGELKKRNEIRDRHHRILWVHFTPINERSLIQYFEEKLNCVIAFDITGFVYWECMDDEQPYKSIAQKAQSHFYLGKSKQRIEMYQNIIKDYKIDGIVMFMHQGCRAIPTSSWELKEISKNMHLPFLELYGDCIDPDGCSYEQMKLRLEAFSESLVNKDVSWD